MAQSSILGGQRAEQRPAGHSTGELGPSDSSDSGSDMQGARPFATAPDDPDDRGAKVVDLDSDGDSSGTGDRASADGASPSEGADILPNWEFSADGSEDADGEVADLENGRPDEGGRSARLPAIIPRAVTHCCG